MVFLTFAGEQPDDGVHP